MTVQGISDGYGPVLGQPGRDYSEINKIDFMTLLVAQIQNQDPMSPMDNAQFTSQLTEFTMLEEMESVNSNLEDNILVGQSINNTGMLALVGKSVTVAGDKTWVAEGMASESLVVTDAPGTATIEVTDEAGNVVATYEKSVHPGMSDVSWDGKLNDGSDAADGEYSISVSVKNGDTEIPATTLMTGLVEGLRYEDNVGVVMIDDHEYYVSEIYKVS